MVVPTSSLDYKIRQIESTPFYSSSSSGGSQIVLKAIGIQLSQSQAIIEIEVIVMLIAVHS